MGKFGDKFRKERERQGIKLEDVSNSTKIGSRMLRAIEEEHFDQLPGGVFNKGFIRAYAKYLSLDEEETITGYVAALNQFNSQEVSPEKFAAQPSATERGSGQSSSGRSSSGQSGSARSGSSQSSSGQSSSGKPAERRHAATGEVIPTGDLPTRGPTIRKTNCPTCNCPRQRTSAPGAGWRSIPISKAPAGDYPLWSYS